MTAFASRSCSGSACTTCSAARRSRKAIVRASTAGIVRSICASCASVGCCLRLCALGLIRVLALGRYRADHPGGHEDAEYERDMFMRMDRFLQQTVQATIDSNIMRVEKNHGFRPPTVDMEAHPDVLAVQRSIDDKVKEAEEAGEEGRVDDSHSLMMEADALRRDKLAAQRRALQETAGPDALSGPTTGNYHLQRCCAVCGAMVSIRDADERLMDHLQGKMHVNTLRVREKLKELRDKMASAARPGVSTPGSGFGRGPAWGADTSSRPAPGGAEGAAMAMAAASSSTSARGAAWDRESDRDPDRGWQSRGPSDSDRFR